MNPDKMLKHCLYTALTAAGVACLPTAQAQTATPAPEQPKSTAAAAAADDDTVVLSPFEVNTTSDKGYRATNTISGSRLDTAIKDIPMPIEVITEKLLRDTGSKDLREGLRYSAGILLQTQNDQGRTGYAANGGVNNAEGATADNSQSTIKIRGYVADTVLRDGYRRQNATDSVNIGRVEVIRGPAALLYGIGNFGGIVNYLPKEPAGKKEAEVSATYGTYNFYRTTLDVGGPLGSLSNTNYRLTAAYQDTGDYTDFKKERHYFVAPIVEFRPFAGTKVLVDLENGKQWQSGIGFQRVRASANVGVNSDQNEHSGFLNLAGKDPRTFRWSGPDTYLDNTSSNIRLQVEQKITKDWFIKAGFNNSEVGFKQRDVQGNLMQNTGPAALRDTVILSPLDQVNGDSNLNIVFGPLPNSILQYFWTDTDSHVSHDQLRIESVYNLKLFADRNPWLHVDNSFLIGHTEDRQDNKFEAYRTPDNVYNYKKPTDASPIRFGKQGDGTADVAMIRHDGNNSQAWNEGTYGIYQGKFLKNRVTLIGGGRRDTNRNAGVNYNYVNNTSSTAKSDSVTQNTFQYGVSVQVTDALSVYALKAEGLYPNFSGNRDINGNPMPAVMAKSDEVGMKFDFLDGKISGTVSAYKIKRSGTQVFYWWAPTSNYHNFDPNKPIVYNVNNFAPTGTPNAGNGGNGAADSALSQWNAGVASGAIYTKGSGDAQQWYVNASENTGAAYLDAVFDYTKSHNMSWPGWLYNYDTETNNSWNDRASSPQGNEYVVGSDSSKGWDAQIMWTPNENFQLLLTYAHVSRVIDSAGQFAKTPSSKDRWAVWYFPNTDWGLTGKPLSTVYGNASDTSTWTGIGYGTGEKQDDTPDHQVSMWSNYTFTKDTLKGLSIGVGGYWESPREYMSGITHGGGQRVTDKNGKLVVLSTSDRFNVDFMARYDFKWDNHDSSVQLNVTNVLNDTKLYGLIYSAPIQGRLTFNYRF